MSALSLVAVAAGDVSNCVGGERVGVKGDGDRD